MKYKTLNSVTQAGEIVFSRGEKSADPFSLVPFLLWATLAVVLLAVLVAAEADADQTRTSLATPIQLSPGSFGEPVRDVSYVDAVLGHDPELSHDPSFTLLQAAPSSVLNLCAAKVLTTLTHELGHARKAIDQGLEAEIDMTTLFGNGTYAGAGNVGSFSFEGNPRDEARICLAGIGSNLRLYGCVRESIEGDGRDGRFTNAVACLSGLELARYTLWDALFKSDASDLRRHRELTGTSEGFLYAAAACNVLDFYLNGGSYHFKRALGREAEIRKWRGLFNTGLQIRPWIDKDKICIGLQLDISF